MHQSNMVKMSSSLSAGKPSFNLSVITTVIVIIITSTVIGVCSRSLTAGGDLLQCGPRCICRRKNPTSPMSMNCFAVVGFSLAYLSTVDASSAVSELDISNNSLTSLSISSLKTFVRLETLIVRWNRLSLIEAGAFIGTQLRRLDLAQNQLAAVRRGAFSGVETTLMELDLSSNSIATVDSAFIGLSALARLDLRHNLLTSLTARSLTGLTGLRHLRLDSNLIANIDQQALVGLSKVTNIALRDNPLSAQKRIVFAANASLAYIDLSECTMTAVLRGIPDTVSYVQLRRNRITLVERDSFLGASRVRILVMDENPISQVDGEAFRTMTDMQQLWLNNNQLIKVPGGLPSSLQRLMLDSNNIQRLSVVSFHSALRLNTVTLMGNAITEIAVGTFRSLTELTHLDLSANKITSLPPGVFKNNEKLATLLLSRNPLHSLDSGCFQGLTQLSTLSLSFVQTRICVDEDVFRPLRHVDSLQVDNSPWLATKLVSSSELLNCLSSLRHLSFQRTDLARLSASFFSTFFPHIESVQLSGSGWVCDEQLMWLRDWLMTSPLASDLDRGANRCAEPASVARRLVVSLTDSELSAPHRPSVPRRKAHQRTGSRGMPKQNTDVACSKRSRSASGVAMTTDVTRRALITSRGRYITSSGSVTSRYLRENDVSDVGLVQAVLIVCTLSVTVVLSAIIIAVIVRLVSLRRNDVTSGLDTSHVTTGSHVSLRHCRPVENSDPDIRRSRAPSISVGGRGDVVDVSRIADHHYCGGGRVAVCSHATGRLVGEAEVERLFTDGCGSRINGDEQWRIYTWEDT